jgi:hypothetical protein
MTMTELANFLGWCTLLNFGLLILASVALMVASKPILAIHGRLMELEPAELSTAYFHYLANYKILILMFNLVPYLALRIMGH